MLKPEENLYQGYCRECDGVGEVPDGHVTNGIEEMVTCRDCSGTGVDRHLDPKRFNEIQKNSRPP